MDKKKKLSPEEITGLVDSIFNSVGEYSLYARSIVDRVIEKLQSRKVIVYSDEIHLNLWVKYLDIPDVLSLEVEEIAKKRGLHLQVLAHESWPFRIHIKIWKP